MADDWSKLTDAELVHEAYSGHGEKAAEMMRRLKDSNERLAKVIIVLTSVLVIVGVLDLYLRISLSR